MVSHKRGLLRINYEVHVVSPGLKVNKVPSYRFVWEIFSLPTGALLACISCNKLMDDLLLLLRFLGNDFSPDSVFNFVTVTILISTFSVLKKIYKR